eukprot:886926-Amphidinium_carterae.1
METTYCGGNAFIKSRVQELASLILVVLYQKCSTWLCSTWHSVWSLRKACSILLQTGCERAQWRGPCHLSPDNLHILSRVVEHTTIMNRYLEQQILPNVSTDLKHCTSWSNPTGPHADDSPLRLQNAVVILRISVGVTFRNLTHIDSNRSDNMLTSPWSPDPREQVSNPSLTDRTSRSESIAIRSSKSDCSNSNRQHCESLPSEVSY